MKHKMLTVLFTLLLVVGVFYFDNGHFGASGFNIYISILFISSLAFYGFDRIKELDLKNLKLVLSEINDAKEQVFAKAEEMKKVMEDLAESYIDSALEVGRLDDDLHKQMIKKRGMAESLLKNASWNEEKIKTKIEVIDHLILMDLIFEIEESAHQMLESNKKGISKIRYLGERDEDFTNLVEKSKSDQELVENIKTYLKNNELPLEPFENQIEDLLYFMENTELKK